MQSRKSNVLIVKNHVNYKHRDGVLSRLSDSLSALPASILNCERHRVKPIGTLMNLAQTDLPLDTIFYMVF